MSEFEKEVMHSLGRLEATTETISASQANHAIRIGSLERKAKWLQGLWAGTGGLLFLYIGEKGWW